MYLYLTGGKTEFKGKRMSDKQVIYHAINTGIIYVHPEALKNGTVALDDFPTSVDVIIASEPPEGALELHPAPRGWMVKE
ncbi:hypothetical protein [Thermus albus]|uniref:hypothetical protein n=1 Tax=Thermus albus TaxID=2908146 RepID=UPI001FAAD093|nr:hypothetical protein [Thermus albus]